jgi:hypothetical protein
MAQAGIEVACAVAALRESGPICVASKLFSDILNLAIGLTPLGLLQF